MSELTDDELLAELGVEAPVAKKSKYSAREERIIAGFEDIEQFFEKHGRLPGHGEDLDIFERLYSVRLDQIRSIPEAVELLADFDKHGLLGMGGSENLAEELGDDELLAELGIELSDESNVAVLKHVASRDEKRAAEEVANRTKCEDFATFKPLFDEVESDLMAGLREAQKILANPPVSQGDFFIVEGQTVYVAEVSSSFMNAQGVPDSRLRVIYSNGLESNLLLRSLQRAFYRDETSRKVERLDKPNLFSGQWDEDDVASGTIYVLRSLSDHPFISSHRELIHKIGVTTGKVETRVAGAKNDATYLLADVEVVATYRLAAVNPTKLENLFHRIFASAQIDLTIEDRFGNPVRPREWFLVPINVIDEAVVRIRDGSITGLVYDPQSARLVKG